MHGVTFLLNIFLFFFFKLNDIQDIKIMELRLQILSIAHYVGEEENGEDKMVRESN